MSSYFQFLLADFRDVFEYTHIDWIVDSCLEIGGNARVSHTIHLRRLFSRLRQIRIWDAIMVTIRSYIRNIVEICFDNFLLIF